MAPLLSIVIPAYNEEKRIGQSLDKLLEYLPTASYKSEVIVVNDGSKDRTGAIVSQRVAAFEKAGVKLRLLSNIPNRGKGYSVKRALTEAEGEIVLFSDTDFSSPITEAPKLIDPIVSGKADVAFGSRALNRKLIGKRQPFMRDFRGRVFNFLMQMITGLRFKDTQCGFKAFRRDVSLPVFRLQSIERFGFDPEILFIAQKLGLRLLEVPVVWNDVEGSTVTYFGDSLNMFLDLIRIRFNSIAGRYEPSRAPQPLQARDS